MGSPIYQYVDTVYMWFLPGVHNPILNFANFKINGGNSIQYGAYLDQSHVGIQNISDAIMNFTLFPNPGSGFTQINYSLSQPASVRLTVINAMGQKLEEIVTDKQGAGDYNHTLTLENYSTGIYYIRIEAGEAIAIRKLIVN